MTHTTLDFTMAIDADGVAVITWDVKSKSMNVLSLEGFEQLDALIDTALEDDAIKGVVITSGKDTFAGGMDLNIIASMKDNCVKSNAQGWMRKPTKVVNQLPPR